jgi:hypothetical protein
MKSETIMLSLTIALAIALVGGLIIVPAIEQADAKCIGFKNNGDVCKPKKPKHNA